eukprot:SAG31_NODE_2887_length_4948_cov_3.419468_3_plen_79_part_00
MKTIPESVATSIPVVAGVWTCIYAVIEAKFENHVGENQKPSSQQLLLEELRNKSANNADDAFALLMCLNSVLQHILRC